MAEKKKKKKHEKPVVVNAAQSNVNISDFYKGMVIDQNGDMFCVMEVIPSPFFQKKVEEQVEILKSELPKVTEQLTKQAGKMSEQYLLLTKKTESYRTRIKEKQLKLVLLSQSALLVLSALFQLLLR